jgi:ABC-type branched-subunit amino acid transport system substrate-binding protein
VLVATLVLASLAALPAEGAQATTQGVTAHEIRIGIAYPDLTAVKALTGISEDAGSYQDAFNAVIGAVNAHGVNGRKLVPFYAPVTPIGTASEAKECTQLTEDDQVFAVISTYIILSPICYIQEHHVAMIQGVLPGAAPAGSAPNFNLSPPLSNVDPRLLAAFAKTGAFKGKKVAVIATAADKNEMESDVLPVLKKDGVHVVQSAVEDAPTNDTTAVDQDVAVIAQRFQSAGATVLVAVGTGASVWLTAEQANQSTYVPRLLALNGTQVEGYVNAETGNDPTYLKGLLSGTATEPYSVAWEQPSMTRCIAGIRKAYPSDTIGSPVNASSTAPQTWTAPVVACRNVALLTAILKAAGKTVTNETFAKGGESLRNISIPGVAGTISFMPGQQYANAPLFLVTYDTKTKTAITSSTPTGT